MFIRLRMVPASSVILASPWIVCLITEEATAKGQKTISEFEAQYGSIQNYMDAAGLVLDKPMEFAVGDTGFTAGVKYDEALNQYVLTGVRDPYGYDISESDELNVYEAERMAQETVRKKNEDTLGARTAKQLYAPAEGSGGRGRGIPGSEPGEIRRV